jgi:hypothetical protein
MMGGKFMFGRSSMTMTITAVVLGLVAIGAGSALADAGRPGGPAHGGGFLPWHGAGFGGYAVQGPGPSQPVQTYDLAPAIAEAAFAEAQFDNRWIDLQLMLARARDDFYVSSDYVAARAEVEQAQTLFETARDSVLARLRGDRTYKDLIEKRTQQQIALKSTAPDSGIRDTVAAEKMRYGAMASDMEAAALADDPAVQDAKRRLVAAQEALTVKRRQFESQLFNRPEIVAARQAMEAARANKAGAQGFLRGAEITRADQLNLNWGTHSGNLVGYGSWWPQFGVGAF